MDNLSEDVAEMFERLENNVTVVELMDLGFNFHVAGYEDPYTRRARETHPTFRFTRRVRRPAQTRSPSRNTGRPPGRPARQADCHPDKKHYGHGMCRACHARHVRKLTK